MSLLLPAVVVLLTAGLNWGGYRLLAPDVLIGIPGEWEEVVFRFYTVSGVAGALVFVGLWPAATATLWASTILLWSCQPDYRKMLLLTGFAHVPLLVRSLLLFLLLLDGRGEELLGFHLGTRYFYEVGAWGFIFSRTWAVLLALGYCTLGLRLSLGLTLLRAGITVAFPVFLLTLTMKAIRALG